MNLNNSLILDIIYPIGSYYWNSNLIDIDNVIGGHWERVKDRFILAVGDTYTTSGATGGEATHTLTINEMPQHTHTAIVGRSGTGNWRSMRYNAVWQDLWQEYDIADQNSKTGGNQAHNNMPPYITAYCWKRIS